MNDEKEEDEEDDLARVELVVVVDTTKLLTATLEVAVALVPAVMLSDSISQAEIPSSDCTARLASHLAPLFRGAWQYAPGFPTYKAFGPPFRECASPTMVSFTCEAVSSP